MTTGFFDDVCLSGGGALTCLSIAVAALCTGCDSRLSIGDPGGVATKVNCSIESLEVEIPAVVFFLGANDRAVADDESEQIEIVDDYEYYSREVRAYVREHMPNVNLTTTCSERIVSAGLGISRQLRAPQDFGPEPSTICIAATGEMKVFRGVATDVDIVSEISGLFEKKE